MKFLNRAFQKSKSKKIEGLVDELSSHMVLILKEIKRHNRVLDVMCSNIENIYRSNRAAHESFIEAAESIRFALGNSDGAPNIQLRNISLSLGKIARLFEMQEE